jgi:hypothetical protein
MLDHVIVTDEQFCALNRLVTLRLSVRLRRFEIITAVKNEIYSSWSFKLAA